MFWGVHSDQHPARLSSRLSVDGVKETFQSEATAAGYLLVDLPAPRESLRGRLSQLIDGAIERALDQRGAPPPAGEVVTGMAAALADQLGRAEVTGATGIALWVAPLAGLTDGTQALDCTDSATLRWWISARETHPIRLGLDAGNEGLAVYLEPVRLGALLAEERHSTRTDENEDEPAQSQANPLCEPLPGAFRTFGDMEAPAADSSAGDDHSTSARPDEQEAPRGTKETDPANLMAESARRMADAIGDEDGSGWLKEALLELSTPAPSAVASEPPAHVAPSGPAADLVAMQVRDAMDAPAPATHADDDDFTDDIPSAPVWEETPSLPRLELRFADDEPAELPSVAPIAAPPPPPPPAPAPVIDAETRAYLERCARELEAANGPKPLGVVERLFATAYSPLRTALDRGADLPRLRHVADEWARSFEKSYTDAFDALRVRSKRPTMVVDVPDVALRIARLHGARSTQLLLVDGMRHDLGQTVNEKLRSLVGQRAACAERFLLWAALPTTTANQIELIGRGPAGLRETPSSVSDEFVVARGKKAAMIRRLKTGHRELFKLDVVEARLTEPGGISPERRDGIADEVAERIALHFEGLQPRTLVMVFGDHGFALEQDGAHPVLRHGGASPEEVLVPAFAWLVGAVH